MQCIKFILFQPLAQRSPLHRADKTIICFYSYGIALTMKYVSLTAPHTRPAQRYGASAENGKKNIKENRSPINKGQTCGGLVQVEEKKNLLKKNGN